MDRIVYVSRNRRVNNGYGAAMIAAAARRSHEREAALAKAERELTRIAGDARIIAIRYANGEEYEVGRGSAVRLMAGLGGDEPPALVWAA